MTKEKKRTKLKHEVQTAMQMVINDLHVASMDTGLRHFAILIKVFIKYTEACL